MKVLVLCSAICLFSLAIPVHADIFIPGDDLYGGKQFSQARQVYLAAARDASDTSYSAAAKYRAAACLYDTGEYDAFAKEAESLLAQNKGLHIEKTVFLTHRLAELPFIRGDWAEAVNTLGKFIAEHPKCEYTFDALNNRAKALSKLNRYNEARQVYLDDIQSQKNSVFLEKAKFKAALCLYEMNDYSTFFQEGRKVLDQYPRNSSIDAEWLRLHLAQISGRPGHWRESAVQLEELIGPAKFTLEHVKISCGRAYLMAAGDLKGAGNNALAEEFNAKGYTYLRNTRAELEGQIASGKKKASNSDVQMMILESHYYEGDFQGLTTAAQRLAGQQQPGSLLWAQGMLWLGIARYSLKPPDYQGAATALDILLEADVKDSDIKNHVPSQAAYWRGVVAAARDDQAGLKAVMEKMTQMPDGPYKKNALNRFKKQMQ